MLLILLRSETKILNVKREGNKCVQLNCKVLEQSDLKAENGWRYVSLSMETTFSTKNVQSCAQVAQWNGVLQ